MKDEIINSLDSESGIIASLIHNPELSFYSEFLKPNHFTKEENRYVYTALCALAQNGITHVDAYNILEILDSDESTRRYAEALSVDKLNGLIEMSDVLARHSVEEYKVLVNNVMDAAFRRDTLARLSDCRDLCLKREEGNIEQKIYNLIDEVMMEYSSVDEISSLQRCH